MSNLPPNKEISFVFDRDNGFRQVLVPRNLSSNGATIIVNGTLSASLVLGVSGSGGGSVGPQGPSGAVGPAGPTGSQGEQGIPGTAPSRVTYAGFSNTRYYTGTANTLRGNAAGFTACLMVRPESFATDLGVGFGNFNLFQANGGWFLGIDGERWKFGVGQQSNSNVVENFSTGLQSLIQYQGRFIRRFFLLHLVYNGTVATLYVNGEQVQQLTPSSGFQVSDSALVPMIGRNTNNGAPQPASTLGFYGAGYGEIVLSATDVLEHYTECLESNDFENNSFTNYWIVDENSLNLEDRGGSLNFTLQGGTITGIGNTARW